MDAFCCLTLKDSQFVDGELLEEEKVGPMLSAIDKLHRGPVTILSFSNRKTEPISGKELLSYSLASVREVNGQVAVHSARVFTSHYVGSFSTVVPCGFSKKQVTIQIEPRFGWHGKVFSRLLAHAYGIYLPSQESSTRANSNAEETDLLMALLWKATLEKALTKSQIPKEYHSVHSNLRVFRGKLMVGRHLHHNLVDQSRFYCQYRQLTMDVTINRAIRYAYALLKESHFAGALKGLAEYDGKLESFGVKNAPITTDEIDRIRYTKLNISYRPTMRLCKSIIQRYSGECDVTGVKNSFSFFLDMAELWEAYLLKVLQRHLTGTGYVVYSPNAEDEEWLVSGQRRRIRPDLVIEREKDGVSVAVLDAKFKYYQEIGQIERGGVSRDDLYQMVTYIYHYASADSPFLGMFVSPCEATGQNNIHPMTSNPKHCISVANLDITRWDDTKFDSKKMDESEETFVKELRKHLY